MIAIDYTVGNAWLVEWMPEKVSGRFQSHLIIYWTIGFIGSYIAGITITGFGAANWQVILASSAVPGLITAIYRSLYRLPASPSWVATHVNNDEAQQLIHENLGRKWGLSKKLLASKAPAKISWKILFTKEYRRQTLVGGLFYACQAFAFFRHQHLPATTLIWDEVRKRAPLRNHLQPLRPGWRTGRELRL